MKSTDIAILVALSLPIGLVSAVYPESFQGFTLGLFWGFLLILVLYHTLRGSLREKWLRSVVVLGLLVRVPVALTHLVIGLWFYGGSIDFTGYFSHAVRIGRNLLRGNFEIFSLPHYLVQERGTAVVDRLLTLGYLLIGPSLPGMFLVTGIIGFLGAYLFLRAFQAAFPSSRETRFLALSLFFLPSLAFWTTLVGKDSCMFFFLGWAAHAVAQLLKEFRFRYLLGIVVSSVFVLWIRAPLGIALIAAIGCSFILALDSRLRVSGPASLLRPVGLLFSLIVIGAALMITLSDLRQSLGASAMRSSLVEGVLEHAIGRHAGLSTTAGGSGLRVLWERPTLSGFLQYLPGGMFTFLFRPFVFEAYHPLALIAALDGTIILVLVLWRWRYLVEAIRSALSKPFLVFCGVVFLLFTAVLSIDSNFGVIVRHRTMVIPFLLILLAVPLNRKRPGSVPVSSTSSAAEQNKGIVPQAVG